MTAGIKLTSLLDSNLPETPLQDFKKLPQTPLQGLNNGNLVAGIELTETS